MSNMLEQAIIDATALKEVAIKNAESQFIEKYSKQIKEAVESILEKDDEEDPLNPDPLMDVENDMGLGDGMEDGESEITSDIPLSALDGEKLCQCPDEEEEIEINFDDLEQKMSQPDQEMKVGSHEELASEIPLDKEEDEIDLDEDQISSLMEELEVDIEPSMSGWRNTTEAEKEDNIDVALAQEQDTEIKKEHEKLKKDLEDIQKENKQLKESNEKISNNNKKYIKILSEAKNKMNSLVLSNAKLLYANKILNSSSLNGRQKTKIVESIQKTKSIEESKVIYESLQNSMSFSNEKKQESLKELIVRPSTVLVPKSESKQTHDNVSERMQILAGIKK